MAFRDFLGNEWDVDCLGCDIISGKITVPGGLIYQGKNFSLHQDPLIPLPGFLVIPSHRHIASLVDMSADEGLELGELIHQARVVIQDVLGLANVTIVQEERSNHFHLWFFPWTEDVVEQYGPPSLNKIRPIMNDYIAKEISDARWAELNDGIRQLRQALNAT